MAIDKRFKYRERETKSFYLYIKYKKSHIYYCVIPEYHKCISTGSLSLKDAKIKANEIYSALVNNKVLNWDGITDKLILSMLPKKPEQLTLARVIQIQKTMLETGISGKTVNNRMSCLSKYVKFPPVPHTKVVRKCYPIEKLYHIGNKNLLALIGITTGMRKGEFSTCEVTYTNGKSYLQVNGTKTENAVRKVPIPEELIPYINEMKSKSWSDRDFRRAVDEIGQYIGVDPSKDNIVFHSYRKCFKTAMMSAGIDSLWQEYYMGHSLDKSNVVSKVYFIPEAADDSMVYEQMIKMIRQFI